jgi:hypothetical protein
VRARNRESEQEGGETITFSAQLLY